MAASSGESTTSTDLGVLIVGHGTRDSVGQEQMRSLACQTAGELSPLPTQLGFLELAQPTIADGVARLAAAGVKQLIIVPVLLFRAGHADRDIPEAVAAAANQHGLQVVDQTPPLEHQNTLLELSAERFSEALSDTNCQSARSDEIALAMIARGSSSNSASSAMLEFARLRVALTPVATHHVGYAAIRQPNVAETLDWLSRTAARVLVVQPHLLFEGEVYHSLRAAVAERQERESNFTAGGSKAERRWLVCRPLATASDDLMGDTRLAKVLSGLVHEALH